MAEAIFLKKGLRKMKTRLTLEGIEWGEFKLADIFTWVMTRTEANKRLISSYGNEKQVYHSF